LPLCTSSHRGGDDGWLSISDDFVDSIIDESNHRTTTATADRGKGTGLEDVADRAVEED